MYTLTLTHEERKAIDWIGGRYRHGYDLYKLLWVESELAPEQINDDGGLMPDGATEATWDSPVDYTFQVPEHVAWEVAEIVNEGLDCFADELRHKLYTFVSGIV